MVQNGKILLGTFLLGFVVGALFTSLIFWTRAERSRELLRERALAAYRDLDTARAAQRVAQERAGALQEELIRLREQAYRIENGTRSAASRAGSLADQLDRAQVECRNIATGIGTAEGILAENRNLLAEFGTILQHIQTRGGTGTEPARTVP